LQTTFRVGLALLTGVERELLTADFEQVGRLLAALVSGVSNMALGQLPAHVCCRALSCIVVADRQLAAPVSIILPASSLMHCTMDFADSQVALQILGVLNAKWFPAFSRSPVELLKTALSFSVTSRLAKYEAEYQSQQAAAAAPPQQRPK
jgi:hypothetical protein